MNNNNLNSEELLSIKIIEAILFSTEKPISTKAIINKIPNEINFDKIMDIIKTKYKDAGFNLFKVSDGWAFRTSSEITDFLTIEKTVKKRLSKAAQEILAIIAYHQPITRAEIENIRGVSVSQGSLETLFESGWVEPKGHKNVPGRPSTWRTTKYFLDHFGLETTKDLPDISELKPAGLLARNVGPSVLKDSKTNN